MNYPVKFENLGLIDYKKAWDYQEETLQKVYNAQQNGLNPINFLLFCEHPHVYTLGQSGTPNNLLISDEFLKKINATYFKINRGGDITYHGPGQIVGYPIFNLFAMHLGVKDYVHKLEESIIQTLKIYGIESSRLQGATGVWLDVNVPGKTRKICAIGVRVSHGITMHGFAFNVNTDLNYFNYINPCGFVDKGVTSLQKELGNKMDFNFVQNQLKEKMGEMFELIFQ